MAVPRVTAELAAAIGYPKDKPIAEIQAEWDAADAKRSKFKKRPTGITTK